MITQLARPLFLPRAGQIARRAMQAPQEQAKTLESLISRARDTEYGRTHFPRTAGYEAFAKSVPLNDYETLKAYIDRMRHGEKDILWPGHVKWYAKSSGTTSDKSKFIPVSPDGLRNIHYRGGSDVVSLYLDSAPHSRMFDGKGLILGGSHAPNYNVRGSLVGDLSAILIENINPLVNLVRVPRKRTALLTDFEVKRDRIARETISRRVTNLSGVPSWMLSVLRRVIELTGSDSLDQVWPDLEVFFHGGVAFTPYREQYRALIKNPAMRYMETYNASEGFFGIQDDPQDKAMLLMADSAYDVFYEFVPADQAFDPQPDTVPLEGIETGKNYAMVITTSCGLWRYMIGDTVMFTSRDPYKFIITGRTKNFINAFGEELIVDNAERGLEEACRQTGAAIAEYTAAPVFMDAEGRCRHQWLIEFERQPDSTEAFADALDQSLQKLNSDYEAKRHKDITLQKPEITIARPGLFNQWLKLRGKLGGQHKVPRLANTREQIEQLLKLNQPQDKH